MQYSKICNTLKWMAGSLLFVFSLQSSVLFAQDSGNSERAAIEIITIEHRDPLFVRAQLMSSLDSRGDIGLVDNKLIIASTAGNLQQLKVLIAQADVPARRLVVSVDFEYGSSRPDNAAQQSSQALEGDAVSFTDGVSDGVSGVDAIGATAEVTQRQPRITINSTTVQGETVEADVEIFNVPGFSGNHSLSLRLGEWYVINPVAEVDAVPDPLSEFQSTDELTNSAVELSSLTLVPDTAESSVDPIAVRVDVLP